jgi:hypothetical protein
LPVYATIAFLLKARRENGEIWEQDLAVLGAEVCGHHEWPGFINVLGR